VGFILDEQMADFFTSVDIAAFPYSRCTATGALHLAAAHESVILASDIEIFRELKRDYNCLEIFDLSDLDDLVTKIEDLLHNDHKREELVSGCRKLVTETSWSAVALKTYAIYQQLITHSI
jgi:glycosyltransferase involved in cell wall biosynthesis